MHTQDTINHKINSYSLRKIPFVVDNQAINTDEIEDIDKLKILELSNFIDEWESEILFSSDGFFSLIGKNVINKKKEFIEELNQLINSKISQIQFSNPKNKELVLKIKNEKLNSIKLQMEEHEKKQLSIWELETFEVSINSCINRAVLYKNNLSLIQSSYRNALTILNLMSEKENWNNKVYSAKKKEFESKFYYSIIYSFIKDKDSRAIIFYEKYKNKLEDKEILDDVLGNFKNNVIGYNWAQELFSYNLSEEEEDKEISSVKNKEIKKIITEFISELRIKRKKMSDVEKENKNRSNWEEIISLSKDDAQKALLHIDYTQSKSNQQLKKNYIKQIINNGFIKTNKKKYLDLIKEFIEDYENFKNKDISDYYESLSTEDFNFIKTLKNKDYETFKSDYNYILKQLKTGKINDDEEKYSILKLIFNLIDVNKIQNDIDKKNKVIKSVFERYEGK